MGTARSAPVPGMQVKQWVRYGVDEADKNLGIHVGNANQTGHHWLKMSEEVAKLAMETTAGRRLGGSVYARSMLAKGAFASKIVHTFRLQVPIAGARENIFKSLQRTLNTLVFGGFHGVTVRASQQPPEDGGLGHINIERKMQAEWARLTGQLLDGKPAVWKNIWWSELRTVYGDILTTPDLLHSTCRFELLDAAAGPSELEKVALRAWGSLQKRPVHQEKVPPSEKSVQRAMLAGDPAPAPTTAWRPGLRSLTGAQLAAQMLWFNCALQGATRSRMFAPSTWLTEREMLRWAEQGIIYLTLVGRIGRIPSDPSVATRAGP